MSRTATTSTKDTRTAVTTLAKVPATPTESQVLAAVNASDKVAGATALIVARYADQQGKTHTQIAAALSKAGAKRSPGSIQNDIRAGRILDRLITGGHTPTLDDVRAAVALGNASEDEFASIATKVPAAGAATGSALSKALPTAQAERSAIRSAKAKKAADDKRRLENTSGAPVTPKAEQPVTVETVAVVSATAAERIHASAEMLARIDSPLGIDPAEFEALAAQVARIGAMLAALPPVTKSTKKETVTA